MFLTGGEGKLHAFSVKICLKYAAVYACRRSAGLIFHKTSGTARVNIKREAALLLFVMFAAGLASQTVIPRLEIGMDNSLHMLKGEGSIVLIPFKSIFTCFSMAAAGETGFFIVNFFGNMAMFIPIGFFVMLLWRVTGKRAVLIGFGVSLAIEICQLFTGRCSDVDDLIINTLGALLGVAVYKLLNIKFAKLFAGFKAAEQPPSAS